MTTLAGDVNVDNQDALMDAGAFDEERQREYEKFELFEENDNADDF